MFEWDGGELDLVRGNEVFDEGDDTLERGNSRTQITPGAQKQRPECSPPTRRRSSRMARTPEGVHDVTPEAPPPESRTST